MNVENRSVNTGNPKATKVFSCGTVTGIASDGSSNLFIVQKDGNITILTPKDSKRNSYTNAGTFLKLDVNTTSESGAQDICFHPNFKTNKVFFVKYSTGPTMMINVARGVATTLTKAETSSLKTVLTIDHVGSEPHHFGGGLVYKDGYLFIAQGETEAKQLAQDKSKLQGKILRIKVDDNGGYTKPSDNPFGNEVYALGIRNAWKLHQDRATGDLYVADVGSDKGSGRERVFKVTSGSNFGWPNTESPTGVDGFTKPLFSWPTQDAAYGACIIGGVLYRGKRFPNLVGSYIYSTFKPPTVRSWKDGKDTKLFDLTGQVTCFGEDENGEFYVGTSDGVYCVT